MSLRDAPEQGIGVHAVRDQHRQTSDHDAVLRELKQHWLEPVWTLSLLRASGIAGRTIPLVSSEPADSAA